MASTEEQFLEAVGLSVNSMFGTHGKRCVEHIDDIIECLRDGDRPKLKSTLGENFVLWASLADARMKEDALIKHKQALYDVIGTLALRQDHFDVNGEYRGDVFCAYRFAQALQSAAVVDTTQNIACELSVCAFVAAERVLLTPDIRFSVRSDGQNAVLGSDFYRTELIKTLLSTTPKTAKVEITNGFFVLSLICSDHRMPATLREAAKSTYGTLKSVSKASYASSAPHILTIARVGGNEKFLEDFLSTPELYESHPEAVHESLELFFGQSYATFARLYLRIAQHAASVLEPHVPFLVEQLTITPQVGLTTLSILEAIAASHPANVWSFKRIIMVNGQTIAGGIAPLAAILGKLVDTPNVSAADEVLTDLVALLDCSPDDPQVTAALLMEINNLLPRLSAKELILPCLQRIKVHRFAAETAYCSIEAFATGKVENPKSTVKMDEIQARANRLNANIFVSCKDMIDVITYIEASVWDIKSLMIAIGRKLPLPVQIEVNGMMPRSFILRYECCLTGVQSMFHTIHWDLWLKVGFLMEKTRHAVIDSGVGNPLHLRNRGVHAIPEIYAAFQAPLDEDFDKFIRRPFLSTEQIEELVESLREQDFFKLFGYDQCCGDWYLINPMDTLSNGQVTSQSGETDTELLVENSSKGTPSHRPSLTLANEPPAYVAVRNMLPPSTAADSVSDSGSISGVQLASRSHAAVSQYGDEGLSMPDLNDPEYEEKMKYLQKKIFQLERTIVNLTAELDEKKSTREVCTGCLLS